MSALSCGDSLSLSLLVSHSCWLLGSLVATSSSSRVKGKGTGDQRLIQLGGGKGVKLGLQGNFAFCTSQLGFELGDMVG